MTQWEGQNMKVIQEIPCNDALSNKYKDLLYSAEKRACLNIQPPTFEFQWL